MKPFKRCWCINPETGREYGRNCPDLKKRHHGQWYARYEAPAADGKRRQPRIGPFDSKTECEQALAEVLSQLGRTGRIEDRKITFADFLDQRHKRRLAYSETGEGLKRSTLTSDREAIELYLKPGLGHLKMVDLRDHHFHELYAAMRLINRDDSGGKPSEMLRRLLTARAAREGRPYSNRPISEARIKRVHAVATGALNDAVKLWKILLVNPADGIFRTKGGGRKRRVKPLLWTDERVAEWERTGKIPHKVMVWTALQCGAFLRFAEPDASSPTPTADRCGPTTSPSGSTCCLRSTPPTDGAPSLKAGTWTTSPVVIGRPQNSSGSRWRGRRCRPSGSTTSGTGPPRCSTPPASR
ncbi:Arm DNA-binding domain-containing protein [Spirillospora albida]|uniref:Arm DNA-binding domain-containing protein n=1 Tax=Spirillospora albida TaxID=58123 RepID=UPI001B804A4A|nr:Arm DNA-binding domain-containing protein [Spirillospora albida]